MAIRLNKDLYVRESQTDISEIVRVWSSSCHDISRLACSKAASPIASAAFATFVPLRFVSMVTKLDVLAISDYCRPMPYCLA